MVARSGGQRRAHCRNIHLQIICTFIRPLRRNSYQRQRKFGNQVYYFEVVKFHVRSRRRSRRRRHCHYAAGPVSSMDTLRMTTVEKSVHTHAETAAAAAATAAAAAPAYFLQLKPRLASKPLVYVSIFRYFFLVAVFGRCHSLANFTLQCVAHHGKTPFWNNNSETDGTATY